MKHKVILVILTILLAISTHHHSYTAEFAINCLDGKNALTQDYKNYLRQQIDLYKSEPVSVASLIDMGKIITGNKEKSYIRDTQNHEGNTLLHIAVTKEDLPVIQDIFAFSSTTHINAQGKKPLDLAIEQLHPKSIKPRNNNQIVILETLAGSIAKGGQVPLKPSLRPNPASATEMSTTAAAPGSASSVPERGLPQRVHAFGFIICSALSAAIVGLFLVALKAAGP